MGIGLAREELVTVNEVQERHRLTPQRMDHMAIIDDMIMLAFAVGATARQSEQGRAAEEELKPVVVKPYPQPVTDQPRRHRVEDLAQREPARGGDHDEHLFIIAGAHARQRLKHRPLGVDALRAPGILARDDLVDEASIFRKLAKVDRSAHQQGITHCRLQMPVRAFYRAILVRNAAVVAARLHPVMAAQRVISVRQIIARRCIQIAERRRQAVAAMFTRRPAQRPQRILQTLRQRDITLAAKDHMGMLEARTGEPEVIQPVVEPDPRDPYTQIGHVRKIRQPHPPRLVHLAEDHIAIRALQRPPTADPTLHRPPHSIGKLRMTTLHFFEHRDGADSRRTLQKRYNLAIEDIRQRIGATATARRLLLRRQLRILLQPIGRRRAERRARRR